MNLQVELRVVAKVWSSIGNREPWKVFERIKRISQ